MKSIKFVNGELFFAIFLYAGVFKESLSLPIDLTVLFLVLTGMSVVWRLSKSPVVERYIISPISIIFLIYTYMLLSFLLTPSDIYAGEKIFKFTLVTLPAILIPFFLFKSRESIACFLNSIAILALTLSVISIPSIVQRGSSLGFIGFNGGNYQGLALLNGAGLLIFVYLYFAGNYSLSRKVLIYISIAIITSVLFSTGSRMPMIAILCSIVYGVFKSFKIRRGNLHIRKGWRSLLFKGSPLLGSGVGSFPILSSGIDISDYPHNIVLEILAELGLVGLTMFCGYFILTLFRGFRLGNSANKLIANYHLTVIALFIYCLANSMVSGDINSNRILYVFMSVLCIVPFVRDKDGQTRKTINN